MSLTVTRLVMMKFLYAGICHSDVHHVRGDWGKEEYPMVPGHEIAGQVTEVGKNVTRFRIGDYAGVGCLVNSCGHCDYCKEGLEQYCKEAVLTYHDHDQFHDHETTQGGYSNNIVLTENFSIKIPENADLKKVAPLLCAGITTYSPIHYSKVKKGDKVGAAGFGGLGHMAVQYMVQMEVYDLDGMQGIFIPNSDEMNAIKEIAANMGTSTGSSISITDNAGSQLAADLSRSAIQGVSQFFSKKMREVKVTLKAGYKVLLLPKQ